jgi:O-antigen ligase
MIVTHVAVTKRDLSIVLWAMMIGGLILGLEAYDTPRRSFVSGRLEGVGGPDFSDANRLAGYMVGLLPIIGVFFLHSGWRGRAALFLAGGFVANTIVLTRCRGAVLGLAVASVVTLVLVPRVYRARLLLAMAVGMAGFLYLADDQFLHRSSTITADQEERDSSAQARFDLAVAGTKMAIRNPLGVGPGNFYQNVGKYDARYEGRDAHSTFTRCLGELGFPGLLLFLAILCSSFAGLRRVLKEAAHLPEKEERYYRWTAIGITAGIVAAFGYGMTGTLLYTEYAWWLLALPICLERALANTKADLAAQATTWDAESETVPFAESEREEPVYAGE